jgi:hypothetical protein
VILAALSLLAIAWVYGALRFAGGVRALERLVGEHLKRLGFAQRSVGTMNM